MISTNEPVEVLELRPWMDPWERPEIGRVERTGAAERMEPLAAGRSYRGNVLVRREAEMGEWVLANRFRH
jgi:hypothetical protein